MAGTPSAHLHVEGSTLLHRLPAHAKLVGLLGFVLATVLVPTGGWAALSIAAALSVTFLLSTRVPLRFLAPRLAVEAPFVVFALALPFFATGPSMTVGPLTVSRAGIVAGATLLIKATVGVFSGVAFATTTRPQDVVRALTALRVPQPLVQILSFMIRYLGVVGLELSRMKIARESRGFLARGPAAWPVLASTTGALFLRSYERGERVHLAMLSRGYTGTLPELVPLHARVSTWFLTAIPAGVVGLATLLAR